MCRNLSLIFALSSFLAFAQVEEKRNDHKLLEAVYPVCKNGKFGNQTQVIILSAMCKAGKYERAHCNWGCLCLLVLGARSFI